MSSDIDDHTREEISARSIRCEGFRVFGRVDPVLIVITLRSKDTLKAVHLDRQ